PPPTAAASALRATPLRLTRPLWLLKPPQALPERHAQPCMGRHALRLLAGPERIETGWWDGGLVARDYFIAQAPEGELLWIYRLRPVPPAGEPGWFLHGRFG
ncbi:MAG TPA: DNA polymerase Y family protein, partial [Ideonella sp.]|nr:DNA polymerase Y family protein [Ideonella sp.]